MTATIKTVINYFFYNFVISLRKEMPLNSVNRNNRHLECSHKSPFDAGISPHTVRPLLGRNAHHYQFFNEKYKQACTRTSMQTVRKTQSSYA
jgi:hypothetical protein